MESKSILIGVVIGLFAGAVIGFALTPTTDISSLESQIQQLQQQISTLEASIKNKDDLVDTLESHVTSLENEISYLKTLEDISLVAVSFSRTEDTSQLLQYWIGRANETIRLMVMLITQDELADTLIAANSRGIDIDVIIDDEWLFSSGSDYQQILDAGVDIRGDDRGALMHHKVMIIDGYVVMTGSYNWSTSAEDRNDENIIILKSETLAQSYLEEFNRIWEQT